MNIEEKKIIEFFTNNISPEDFAKKARRFMHVSLTLLLNNEDEESHVKEWIKDGHSVLHDFCELLNPYLEAQKTFAERK